MSKHLVKMSILLTWLGLLGWWGLESRTWPAPEKIEAAFLPDHYDLFAVEYQGRKVGWAFKSLTRFPNGGYQAAQGLRIKTEILERTLEVQLDVSANLGPALDLDSFNYTLNAAPVTAAERGVARDGLLSVKVNLGEYGPFALALLEEHRALLGPYAEFLDFSRETRLPAPAGPGLASCLGPYLSHLGLARGANYTLTVLDPVTRRLMPLQARVEAETKAYDPELAAETAAFLVRTGPPEAGTRLWLDRFGRTLKEEALGFTLTLVEDQAEASRDISPLQPPAAWRALAEGDTWRGLADKFMVQGRQ